MITHFAELELQTVSISGVKQVYADRLGFPICEASENRVAFSITPFMTLTFVEQFAPISPAHFAMQVSYSEFYDAVEALKSAGLLVISDVSDSDGRLLIYFRDGDGNLLEIIAHDYISLSVLSAHYCLHVLYMREIGFPVVEVEKCRTWMMDVLGLKMSENSSDQFGFMIGGTAHVVVVDQKRPWIPIGMQALPPAMKLVWGTPSLDYLSGVRERLNQEGVAVFGGDEEIGFELEGYRLGLRYTTDISEYVVADLNLP